jgi:hypothetical protein
LEILLGFGISGSAVRPNLEDKVDFESELNEIRLPYDLRLAELRNKLKRLT